MKPFPAILLPAAWISVGCFCACDGDKDETIDIPLTCAVESDCADPVPCTVDVCRDTTCFHFPDYSLCPPSHECDPERGCVLSTPCLEDADCEDWDPCTMDRCYDITLTCRRGPMDEDGDLDPPRSCGGTDCKDDDPAVSGAMPETCNGIDDDCDHLADEGFECIFATTQPCEVCGETGISTCSEACVFSVCELPPESTLECTPGEERPCLTPCGNEVAEVCDAACRWPGCVPVEECNGLDDDCLSGPDDVFECVDGSSEPCTTTCGTTGARTCVACAWSECEAPEETCNGQDDDCDTQCDNGYTCCAGALDECVTTSGAAGLTTCSDACAWTPCSMIGWAGKYGLDAAKLGSILPLADGRFIAAGSYSTTVSRDDAWIFLLSDLGEIISQSLISTGTSTAAISIVQTSDGKFAAVGGLPPPDGSGDFDLMGLDETGHFQWQKTFQGPDTDQAIELMEDASGGFWVFGYTRSSGGGQNDYLVIRTDATGHALWQKTYGGPLDEVLTGAARAGSGSILAGNIQGSGDTWIVNLDETGEILWQKTLRGGGIFWLQGVQEVSTGGFILAGSTQTLVGDLDLWVVRLDADGAVVWQRAYGGDAAEGALEVLETSSGEFLVAGYTETYGAGNGDAWCLLLDSSGGILWQKTYGGTEPELVQSIHEASDGGFILGGSTFSFGTWQTGAMIIKIDHDGNLYPDCPSGLPLDSSASVLAGGATTADTSFVPGIASLVELDPSVSTESGIGDILFRCGP